MLFSLGKDVILNLQVSDVPRVTAYASEENVCVLANEYLSLFQDSCHKIQKTMVFGEYRDLIHEVY